MPSTHSFTIRLPLPPHLTPADVLEHLHSFESLITPHPYLVGFERTPVSLASLVADPFFTADGHRLAAFVVTERIALIPGLTKLGSKNITVPAVFQSYPGGVRCRAEAAAGVRVWQSYSVCKRDPNEMVLAASGRGGGGGGSDEADAGDEYGYYELVEAVTLQCPGWAKPFVVKSIEPAHREICERMVEEMSRAYAGGSRSSGSSAGEHAEGTRGIPELAV